MAPVMEWTAATMLLLQESWRYNTLSGIIPKPNLSYSKTKKMIVESYRCCMVPNNPELIDSFQFLIQ